MTKRVRLSTERELRVIGDNGLHEALVGVLADDVGRALDALRLAIPGDTVTLELVTDTLAGLLFAQDRIRRLVAEVIALGATPLDERQLSVALACWIIDNQIGRGFEWDPWVVPVRRSS